MTDSFALMLRLGFSFTIVLLLLWVCARVLRSKVAGRPGDGVEVLARTQLGRGASVAVLRVADRALVLGVTERGIVQLGEPITDLAAFAGQAAADPPTASPAGIAPGRALEPVVRPGRRGRAAAPVARTPGPLGGSILSPATWSAALDVLRERTVRRG